MNKEAFIFEVTEASFQESVVENSSKLPVIVGFMAAWSEHCFVVDHIFSTLAREFPGEFIFAKVDIDEQPELRKGCQIENVPTTVVFQEGKPVRVEMGALNEDEARLLLRDFGISHESDVLREEARAKHLSGDTPGAIMLLTQAIQKDPGNTRVAMDMVQIFIDVNELENADGLFKKLPEQDRNSPTGKSLNDQLLFAKVAAQTAGLEVLQQQVAETPDDLQARFDLSMCLMVSHEPGQAMEQLLAVVEKDADFKDGAAKEMLVSIIRMCKTTLPELAQEYQRKLSNILAG